jgi:DNA-binding FadR family transcriptional regulator
VASEQIQFGHQVRVPKTAELIARQLRRQIMSGVLQEGDTLPFEPVLMAQFQVSRPTLREAYRILEAESLLVVRPGRYGGPTVIAPKADVAARQAGHVLQYRGATLADVYYARTVVEAPAARMLTLRKTEADIDELQRSIDRASALLENSEDAIEEAILEHHHFHNLVVKLAGNQTLVLLALMVDQILETANFSYVAVQGTDRFELETGRNVHQNFLQLVKSGDASAAEELWESHLRITADPVIAELETISIVGENRRQTANTILANPTP